MARATGYCRNKEGSRDSQLIHNCSVELSRLGLWEGRMQGGWAREGEPGGTQWLRERARECSVCPLRTLKFLPPPHPTLQC